MTADATSRICELMRRHGLSATEALAVHARDDLGVPLRKLEKNDAPFGTGRGGIRAAYSRAQKKLDDTAGE